MIVWQVQFFLIIRLLKNIDKYAFSLFHDFSDDSLLNHSYVISPDVQSLNHMNMKYVKRDWITNATTDYLAPRTMMSFRKWSFWSYKNMTNIIITIPIFFTAMILEYTWENLISWKQILEKYVPSTSLNLITKWITKCSSEIWLMILEYLKICSSERIIAPHHFRSYHWELHYLSIKNISAPFKTDSTQLLIRPRTFN